MAERAFLSYQQVGLKPRDAVHAATMRNNGISRLISADAHFDRLTFVTRIDPLVYPLAD
jgi:predicted nucleic acid-binding protein